MSTDELRHAGRLLPQWLCEKSRVVLYTKILRGQVHRIGSNQFTGDGIILNS